MEGPELENAILELVRRPSYRPVKPRVLAQRLQIAQSEVAAVRKAVKRLVARGRLAYGSGHLVRSKSSRTDAEEPKRGRGLAPPSRGNRIVGVFHRKEAGFGFVRPAVADPGEAQSPDIYVAAEDAGDASTRDVVAVQLKTHRARGRPGPRGEIVDVIERETHRFVGTYFEARGTACVQVDGPLFSRPILVGDPGARDAKPNDKVVLEMVRFPSHVHEGEGVIVEVLGPRGAPGVDTLSVIREFNLPEQFPEDVLDEARKQAERFDESIPPGRRDATDETVITIDPADARDFDDAISLVRLEGGGWRLGVHIADVAHFVPPRSALDRKAYQRATSVYLPDRVIPMLPELISNSLASLQPNKLRYTKSVYLDFTPEGVRAGSKVCPAAIRSRRRLTYEQVDQFLADPGPLRRKWGAAVCALLDRMRSLAAILRRRRVARGALELSMPEVKVDLDKQGRVAGAHVEEYTESHQVIEEFMLAANEAVAEMLDEKGLLFLRRIHRPPKLAKLKALAEFVAELGLPADNLQSRFGLQALLAAVAGRPERHAVNYAVLRSLQRAVYGPEDEGHFALASDCYCHFTSPIRRYPDLTVHRLLDDVLRGGKPAQDLGKLVVAGEHCSEQEQRAEEAERELTRLKLFHYLSTRIGEEMDALITGVESFGLFVEGVKLPAEGLIHVDSLVDDYYRYDRTTHTLSGYRSGNSFRLGDLVRVAVARVDLERRELDFRLIQREQPPGRQRRARIPGGKRPAAQHASGRFAHEAGGRKHSSRRPKRR